MSCTYFNSYGVKVNYHWGKSVCLLCIIQQTLLHYDPLRYLFSQLHTEVEKPLLTFRGDNFKKDLKKYDHHITDLRKQLASRYAGVEKVLSLTCCSPHSLMANVSLQRLKPFFRSESLNSHSKKSTHQCLSTSERLHNRKSFSNSYTYCIIFVAYFVTASYLLKIISWMN